MCCSYYLLVSPSVLPPAAYPALLTHGVTLLRHSGDSWPSPQLPPLEWLAGHLAPVQLAGSALFVAGNLLQWHSHWLLARLSRAGSRAGYKIPRGGRRRALMASCGSGCAWLRVGVPSVPLNRRDGPHRCRRRL